MGAARAVCGDTNGVVVILGTGSNSCLYRNGEIEAQVPNLGYLLGDEGAGCTLGKMLMKTYVYSELPDDLAGLLESEMKVTRDSFVTKLYASDVKNRYLASFAPFCVKYKDWPEINQIINKNFNDFIEHHLLKYQLKDGEQVNAIGSIAALLKPELEQCLQEHGLQLGRIIKNPIQSLVQYHLDH